MIGEVLGWMVAGDDRLSLCVLVGKCTDGGEGGEFYCGTMCPAGLACWKASARL
jgi:hypothetical protein